MQTRNARLGLWFFGLYLLLYGGFVLLAAFSPATLERTPFADVNLAIWYGFGLIVAALVMALLYGWLCRPGNSTANQIRNQKSEIRNSK